LTGLHNRRGFFSLAQHFLNTCEREDSDVFLLFIDLDNLKHINDKFGHDAGDSLLIETGKILKGVFRKSDIIGRIGGDEFVTITRCDTEASSAQNNNVIVERLENRLKEHNEGLEDHQKVHFSYGLVKYDKKNPCSIEELTSKADKLMYEYKKQKKEKEKTLKVINLAAHCKL
jgi:diguanylate cyclase (GGDEF)-like protein